MTDKEKIEKLLFSDDSANVELAITLAKSLGIDISQHLKDIELLFNQAAWHITITGEQTLAKKLEYISMNKHLTLGYRGFKAFPPILKYQKQVDILILEGNDISELPPEFAQMQKLERLRLGKNKFEHFPLESTQIPSICDLFLNFNKIKIIPPEIGKMTNLQNVFLGGNLISTLPAEMQYLSRLETISLANNPLDFSKIPPVLFDAEKSPKALVNELVRLIRYPPKG